MQNNVQRCAGIGGWLCSTIGRKQIVGVTGLGLSFFVLTHMLGNMLILVSPQAYNEYGHKLVTNPLIEIAEIGLVGAFLAHLAIALKLQVKNWCARGSRYAVSASGDKATSPVQKMMWFQGLLILFFLVSHLVTFKYGEYYSVNYGQGDIRDLHKLIVEVFSQPGYVAWYVVSMIILGLHLSHGVGSAFQTLGVHHPRYQKPIRCFSIFYALVVAGGFLSQPIYVFFLRS